MGASARNEVGSEVSGLSGVNAVRHGGKGAHVRFLNPGPRLGAAQSDRWGPESRKQQAGRRICSERGDG